MHKTISATKARKEFFKVLEFASKPGSSVTITLEGHTPLVIMSQQDFEGWQETLEIMSDPQLMKDIRAAMKEKKTIPWSVVKKELGL
ncbi:MAG: type II toxin-antitoxin system Phd/YefM family antitoxin [Candidatus Peregrinibacteria bacterium]|nr:type II toxin-antitoxin system Phd/YefM family antitoxin [Candidatus Peregrinibacteria bacterium]